MFRVTVVPANLPYTSSSQGHPPSWVDYVTGMIKGAPSNTTVVIKDVDYLLKVARVIAGARVEVATNYIVWMAVREAMPLLNREFRDAWAEFEDARMGRRDR